MKHEKTSIQAGLAKKALFYERQTKKSNFGSWGQKNWLENGFPIFCGQISEIHERGAEL